MSEGCEQTPARTLAGTRGWHLAGVIYVPLRYPRRRKPHGGNIAIYSNLKLLTVVTDCCIDSRFTVADMFFGVAICSLPHTRCLACSCVIISLEERVSSRSLACGPQFMLPLSSWYQTACAGSFASCTVPSIPCTIMASILCLHGICSLKDVSWYPPLGEVLFQPRHFRQTTSIEDSRSHALLLVVRVDAVFR